MMAAPCSGLPQDGPKTSRPAADRHHPTGSPQTGRKYGLRAAIDAYCRSCAYDQHDAGTWRQQVGRCACSDCPLWVHRPMPTAGAPAGLEVADG